jgi:hypothetical protein
MARNYELANLKVEDRWERLRLLEEALFEALPVDLPLFLTLSDPRSKTKNKLARFTSRFLNDQISRNLFETLVVLSDSDQRSLDRRSLLSSWKKLKEIVKWLPYSPHPLRVFNCDARSLPLLNKSVHLVVTSPPYINVHNYHQQARAAAEGLGWDLLDVARSEIGSNRKHRANRFLTVIQYCLDIALVLSELARVCRNGSRVIFIVGRESRVRGVPFYNAEIVAQLATSCVGFELLTRQERSFVNKFGVSIFEDILHFTGRPQPTNGSLDGPRAIAEEVLKAALESAPKLLTTDIRSALESVGSVEPSPMYDASTARPRSTRTYMEGYL